MVIFALAQISHSGLSLSAYFFSSLLVNFSSDQFPLCAAMSILSCPCPVLSYSNLSMFTLLDEARLHYPARYSDRSAFKFNSSSSVMTNDVASIIHWNKSEPGKLSVLLFVSAVILQ